MTYPLVRFVSAPELDADVRFDFHTAGDWPGQQVWPDPDGFSLGAPTLEGDLDAYGVQYGFRQIAFTFYIEASKTDAAAIMNQLARELLRHTNWLRVEFSEFAVPVWFRTRRRAPAALTFDHVNVERDKDVWGVPVSLDADPFAYGERVTVPPHVIANDPSAVGGTQWVLPPILGDAPTPLRIDVTPSVNLQQREVMITVAASDDPPGLPIVWQVGTGDSFTPGSDCGPPVTSPYYSGGSFREVSFATTPNFLATRLSCNEVLAPPAPGRYRVMLRAYRTLPNSSFVFQVLRADTAGEPLLSGDYVAWDNDPSGTSYATWLDLGDQSFPIGGPVEDLTPGNVSLILAVLKDYGNALLRLDAFLLLPVQDATTIATRWGTAPSSTVTGRWDGDLERAYLISASSGHILNARPLSRGSFPTADPARSNALYLLMQTSTSTPPAPLLVDDEATQSATVQISYHPRYLYLADST